MRIRKNVQWDRWANTLKHCKEVIEQMKNPVMVFKRKHSEAALNSFIQIPSQKRILAHNFVFYQQVFPLTLVLLEFLSDTHFLLSLLSIRNLSFFVFRLKDCSLYDSFSNLSSSFLVDAMALKCSYDV